jgi:hypothetical protein
VLIIPSFNKGAENHGLLKIKLNAFPCFLSLSKTSKLLATSLHIWSTSKKSSVGEIRSSNIGFIHSFTHSFIHEWLYSPLLGADLFFSFVIFLYRRQDSLDGGSARRKAATYTQNNTNIEQTHTDIHALSEIRTHDPSVRASEDSSCPRPRGHCDRLKQ